MKIQTVFDADFAQFGRVLPGNHQELLELLKNTPMPEKGTIYCPSDKQLEREDIVNYYYKNIYGEMPIQIGYCNGHNQVLNCLEYHKGNEVNMANEDFILLLGSFFDIHNNQYDTKNVKAFLVPKGTAVEVYSTTLHYAPCGINGSGFKMIVILPKGTNVNTLSNKNDPTLRANNKWLLAHKDAPEAKQGAYVGLVGENIKI